MIANGEARRFDLIITKEISRFARNTLDSIQYTRQLRKVGAAVYFQSGNINTADGDSELRLAQGELRKLSERVKFGLRQAIKNGVVLGNSRIFGYHKDSRQLIVDEDEAPIVRELFHLYATGRFSMKHLETIFWEKGYRNHNGKKIAHNTMFGMISNLKYKGYYKVKVVDMFTKCGTPYYRRDSADRGSSKSSKWGCSGKPKSESTSCPSSTMSRNSPPFFLRCSTGQRSTPTP